MNPSLFDGLARAYDTISHYADNLDGLVDPGLDDEALVRLDRALANLEAVLNLGRRA